MLIYGDVSDSAEVAECLSRLRECAAAAMEYGDAAPLDPLRALLIQAGQVEQAVEDEPECGEHLAASCRHLTDRAAAAFVNRWAAAGTDGLSIRSHLSEMTRELERLGAITSAELKRPVRLKVPEGFAFYGLYPAQYYAAAEQWMADRTPPRATDRHALVVGVRSIGTSLSAVVAATLKRRGWQATRLTVRPEGHPFKRHIHISPRQLCGPTEALVVDEGPGLSGSSMAAVAKALAQAGLEPGKISFLPGHGGPPGVAASAESRYWWARTRRYFVPLEQLRRAGRTLMDALRFRTEQLLHDEVTRVEDLSAGQWRSALYADPPLWPPICRRFERRKYR
ncbi:MAG: Cell division protein FtsK, partial [Phycisphaerales bacterium]|nr:Cell division protein FtsK [Phycisphaerales bacterium]